MYITKSASRPSGGSASGSRPPLATPKSQGQNTARNSTGTPNNTLANHTVVPMVHNTDTRHPVTQRWVKRKTTRITD